MIKKLRRKFVLIAMLSLPTNGRAAAWTCRRKPGLKPGILW